MRPIDVRLGKGGDVDDAASVYERSNLARRQGSWPSRSARVAQVTASLHDAARHEAASWFLIGREGTEAVAMALVHPFRADGGSSDVIVGAWFLSLISVLPERWGTGISGMLLDAAIDEAKRRGPTSPRTSAPIDCTAAAASLPPGARCTMTKAT